MTKLIIPDDLLPVDGRFGAGPALVRQEQLDLLARDTRIGTSHRQAPVKNLVSKVRSDLAALYNLPQDYTVILGNGGSTAFWDMATFGLIRERSSHAAVGEFGSKFVTAATRAPFLADPYVVTGAPGTSALPENHGDADVLAWVHNETSTAVVSPVQRLAGNQPSGTNTDTDQLVVIDGTSAAAGIEFDAPEVDVYYFAPQKGLGSDGGMWLALCSPKALARIEELEKSRWIPSFLSLQQAVENSVKEQTLNTPAVATLALMSAQLDWIMEHGGLAWAAGRSKESSDILYNWATHHELATPFVPNPADRSPVIATIDFADSVSAAQIAEVLRGNGIVDTEPYRKLGRNQLRISTYPSVQPSDVLRLTASIDFILDNID